MAAGKHGGRAKAVREEHPVESTKIGSGERESEDGWGVGRGLALPSEGERAWSTERIGWRLEERGKVQQVGKGGVETTEVGGRKGLLDRLRGEVEQQAKRRR